MISELFDEKKWFMVSYNLFLGILFAYDVRNCL